MAKCRVYLHGYLAAFHDGPIEVTGNTIAELVEAVTRQLPGFAPHPVRGRHRIKVAGADRREDLFRELGECTEIHLTPQMNGGKSGGLSQILLGIALIGVGFFLGGTLLGSMLIKVGAMMLLGGLAAMLAPTPETDKDEETKSRYLGSPRNTTEIGTRIPVLYGECRVGGQILAFDINAIEFRGTAKNTGGQSSK